MLSIRFVSLTVCSLNEKSQIQIERKIPANGPLWMRDKMFQHFTNVEPYWAHIRIQIDTGMKKYTMHFPCEWYEKRKINKRYHWIKYIENNERSQSKHLKIFDSELRQQHQLKILCCLLVTSFVYVISEKKNTTKY